MITSGLVNVFTHDVTRAMSFYADDLGLSETFRTPTTGVPDHVELSAGGFVLALSSAEAARRVHGMEAQVGPASMSLVFWVDDLDATYADLTGRGVPGVTEPHDTGNDNRNAVVRDPDGALVELVAKRSGPSEVD